MYSWGVLHHTGDLWRALELVSQRVKPGGKLFISIYNDQGWQSRYWLAIKRWYVAGGRVRRALLLTISFIRLWGPTFVRDLFQGRPFGTWRGYRINRGMDPWRDLVDWVGGYPFEVAKPEAIFDALRARGFALERLITVGGRLGCNEFVFAKPN